MKSLLTTTAVAALSIGLMACVWKAKAEPANCSVPVDSLAYDGVTNTVSGKLNCPNGSFQTEPEISADETLALSAALSTPAWLGDSENFSVSGGLGFSDGATAVGATGLVRLDKTFSAFAGGAVNTDGDGWAGKAGFRAGW